MKVADLTHKGEVLGIGENWQAPLPDQGHAAGFPETLYAALHEQGMIEFGRPYELVLQTPFMATERKGEPVMTFADIL